MSWRHEAARQRVWKRGGVAAESRSAKGMGDGAHAGAVGANVRAGADLGVGASNADESLRDAGAIAPETAACGAQAVGAGSVAGAGARDASSSSVGGAKAMRSAPQCLQNRAPGRRCAPHAGQNAIDAGEAGVWAEARTGACSEAMGAGADTGTDAGSGVAAGSGSGVAAGSGTRTAGAGAGSGTADGIGATAGAGTGTDAAAGTGSDTEIDRKGDPGTATAAGTGAGSGTGTLTGTGPARERGFVDRRIRRVGSGWRPFSQVRPARRAEQGIGHEPGPARGAEGQRRCRRIARSRLGRRCCRLARK